MALLIQATMEGADTLRQVVDVDMHGGAPKIIEVPKGSTGTIVEVEYREANLAKNYQAASGSLYFHARTQDGTAVTTDGVATWTTNGSDGKIRRALSAAEVSAIRDLICEFEIQGWNGGNLVQPAMILRVTDRAKV